MTYNAIYSITVSLDYISIVHDIVLSETSGETCCNITVKEDGLVEDTEFFAISLSSSDIAVMLESPSMASVVLLDSDGKCG